MSLSTAAKSVNDAGTFACELPAFAAFASAAETHDGAKGEERIRYELDIRSLVERYRCRRLL